LGVQAGTRKRHSSRTRKRDGRRPGGGQLTRFKRRTSLRGDDRSGEYQLDGTWLRQGEALVLRSHRGGVRTRFSAAKLHLVAAAPQPATLHVTVDDGASQAIEVERPTLYTLFDSTSYVERVMSFVSETPGLSLFSATFG
jgi:hypothetical protein